MPHTRNKTVLSELQEFFSSNEKIGDMIVDWRQIF